MEFLAFCQSNVSRSPREVPDYASYKKKQKTLIWWSSKDVCDKTKTFFS